MNKIKLSTKNLSLYYDKKRVLNQVNINILDKKITALIGPSGCGKSTLLRSFNRMNDEMDNFKLSGEILLDNQNIYSNNINIYNLRKRIGMVFQKPNPFPKSIYENIAYGVKLHNLANNKQELDEIVVNSLKLSGLYEEVKDNLNNSALLLSGGQQQRLCIARSIAVNPEVLLMDEPTSALDPVATMIVENLMLNLSSKFTIILVTHSMHQASRVSQYTGFFYKGDLIEYNETKKIFTNPSNDITEKYITGRFA